MLLDVYRDFNSGCKSIKKEGEIHISKKIDKLRAELSKNKEKIETLSTLNEELDKQITELENLEIVGMVRSFKMTPEELLSAIQKLNAGKINNSCLEDGYDEEI